jgi:XTP/dITP diphosphohydrolase
MRLTLVLASGNPGKASEFKRLAEAGRDYVDILPADAVGGMPSVAEDTGTFSGNALKKARALAPRLPPGHWALADDSGLCVDALGGLPGVESAYFAGPEGGPSANLAKLVREMSNVPEGGRSAHFTCVLAVAKASGEEHLFEGRCDGRILPEPRGAGGFGYDPLFVPDGFEMTFAEMDAVQKNRISHRAAAWRQLARWARRSVRNPA